MSITYTLNEKYDGIEIKFSDKPNGKVLAELKKLGFRWHGVKKVWYAKQNEQTIQYAKQIEDKMECEQTSLFEEKKFDPEKPTKKSEPKKATKKAEPKKTTKKVTKKEEPEKVVDFPQQLSFTFGEPKADIETFKAKVAEEKKAFKEPEHAYVLDGLVKMAESSHEFIENYMKTSYKQEFENVTKEARKRAKNGVCCMSADDVLQIICEHVLSTKTKVKEG